MFRTPLLSDFAADLAKLDRLQRELGERVALETPWVRRFRARARTAAVSASLALDGVRVRLDASEALEGGRGAAGDEDQRVVASTALALRHVGVLAGDPALRWTDRLLLDLHFEACSSEPMARPGRWREEAVHGSEAASYRGPEAVRVQELTGVVLEWLDVGSPRVPPVVRGALAHLNLVSIQPFSGRNGRLALIVQSLAIAQGGVLPPELGSIEAALARDPRAYAEALREARGESYQTQRSAAPWLAFCVDAHLTLTRERLDQLDEAARRWTLLDVFMERRGWPQRLTVALEQSLSATVDRASYTAETDVSPATASGDLRRLLDAGLLDSEGRGRNTRYRATDTLRRMVREG